MHRKIQSEQTPPSPQRAAPPTSNSGANEYIAWQEKISVEMTRWTAYEYRAAFREAGLSVAEQDNVPDRETEILPAGVFPTEKWGTREAMVERYRSLGTLLTVGVAP